MRPVLRLYKDGHHIIQTYYPSFVSKGGITFVADGRKTRSVPVFIQNFEAHTQAN